MSNTEVIVASAKRIIELAQALPEKKRRDFEVEATTIVTLVSKSH